MVSGLVISWSFVSISTSDCEGRAGGVVFGVSELSICEFETLDGGIGEDIVGKRW